MQFDRYFRLADGVGTGVCRDERGLFVGDTPLLEQVAARTGRAEWRSRRLSDLNCELAKACGLPVEFGLENRPRPRRTFSILCAPCKPAISSVVIGTRQSTPVGQPTARAALADGLRLSMASPTTRSQQHRSSPHKRRLPSPGIFQLLTRSRFPRRSRRRSSSRIRYRAACRRTPIRADQNV